MVKEKEELLLLKKEKEENDNSILTDISHCLQVNSLDEILPKLTEMINYLTKYNNDKSSKVKEDIISKLKSLYIVANNSKEKKEYEKNKKLEKIKTERMLKEEKEIQEKPKINYNSKKIMGKKYQNKTDVFDRLSDISQIQNHNDQIEKIRERFKESHTPLINDNSRRMKRK